MAWKKKWNEEGVSPVIATILMVAITVVLAAVLYVMVMGFTTTAPAPTVGKKSSGKESAQVYKIVYTVNPGDKPLSKFKVMVDNTTTATAVTILAATVLKDGALGGTAPISVSFKDLLGDGKFNEGDYLTLSHSDSAGFASNTKYTVRIIWADTGAEIISEPYVM